jgi:hypothetical protein
MCLFISAQKDTLKVVFSFFEGRKTKEYKENLSILAH